MNFQNLVNKAEVETPVEFSAAYALNAIWRQNQRLSWFNGIQEGKAYALYSRVVGVLGIAETIEAAREVILEGSKPSKVEHVEPH